MRLKALGLYLLAAAACAVPGSADAFLPEGPDFAMRAGSVASPGADQRTISPEGLSIALALHRADGARAVLYERDRSAIAAFYRARAFAPAWTADGRLTDAARQLVFRIARASVDGLEASDYRLPPLGIGLGEAASRDALAEAELKLSQAVVAYARDAQAGRVEPNSVSSTFITMKPEPPDPLAALRHIASAGDPVEALESYNPPHEGFRRLREALFEARLAARTAKEAIRIAPGPLLRLGASDARVVDLRRRLDLPTEIETPERYDETVREAVMDFQRDNALAVDGVVGPQTVMALNGEVADRTADIVANMERWRWLPRDLGPTHIMVNVPEFVVRVRQGETTIHQTNVIVGTAKTQTPVFSDEMDHVVVNPSWGVPQSIFRRDMLPNLQSDPTYLDRRGIHVYARVDGRVRRVSSSQVDWFSVNPRQLSFRQPPGSANALGQIKFMFPNEHAVYLHDTPTKNLFARGARAFSNGCVRVENPWDFAAVVLAAGNGIAVEEARALVGGGEKRINLPKPVPIHLVYFTLWVDDEGNLEGRNDIYGHDARMREAFGVS